MLILTVNCGSSSLKIDLLESDEKGAAASLASARLEASESGGRLELRMGEAQAEQIDIASDDQADAAKETIVYLRERGLLSKLVAVGHRVVHGGPSLTDPVLLSRATISHIRAATDLAPLHNGPSLVAIEAAREALPDVPHVATFDTAFFRDLPPAAATYAIPADLARKFGIKRYGFHGLAHRYMSERFGALSGKSEARLVTLQLGSGCSATALRRGRPLDTSMGFTPVEGLVMATRSGDIDPSLPLYLAGKPGETIDSIEALLSRGSGLAGLAGGDKDMRRLLERQAAGDKDASLAVDVFCYRIRKYLGAYAAVLGGLDGVVFGGGIGENAAAVRQRVCSGFEWLGLEIDGALNAAGGPAEHRISSAASAVDVWVIPVDESKIIAADTIACLGAESE